MQSLPPEISQRIAEISADDVSGAADLARRGLRIVEDVVTQSKEPDRDAFLARVREVSGALARARPEMAPARVWQERLRAEVERLAGEIDDVAALRVAVGAAIEALIVRAEQASHLAAQNAATLLPAGSVVFTASDSMTIREAVRLARQVGRLRRLLVAESDDGRGHRYGQLLANAVGASGVPVEIVPDAAIAPRVGDADRVWLGADTIFADGTILNGAPSEALAAAAKVAGKTVEVIGESAKIDELASPEDVALAPGLDRVPGELIDVVVTEEGIYKGGGGAEGRRGEVERRGDAGTQGQADSASQRPSAPPPLALVEQISERLVARGEKLAVAESAAGGRICDLLSDRPGSSAWLAGGILAYSNESKRELAEVPAETLTAAGTVSAEVALALAEGARRRFGTAWGIGETGIAGPQTGRRSSKPAGLAYVAVVGPNGSSQVEEVQTNLDDRAANKQGFALAALTLLSRALDPVTAA